jgi:hypothetical protein
MRHPCLRSDKPSTGHAQRAVSGPKPAAGPENTPCQRSVPTHGERPPARHAGRAPRTPAAGPCKDPQRPQPAPLTGPARPSTIGHRLRSRRPAARGRYRQWHLRPPAPITGTDHAATATPGTGLRPRATRAPASGHGPRGHWPPATGHPGHPPAASHSPAAGHPPGLRPPATGRLWPRVASGLWPLASGRLRLWPPVASRLWSPASRHGSPLGSGLGVSSGLLGAGLLASVWSSLGLVLVGFVGGGAACRGSGGDGGRH